MRKLTAHTCKSPWTQAHVDAITDAVNKMVIEMSIRTGRALPPIPSAAVQETART